MQTSLCLMGCILQWAVTAPCWINIENRLCSFFHTKSYWFGLVISLFKRKCISVTPTSRPSPTYQGISKLQVCLFFHSHLFRVWSLQGTCTNIWKTRRSICQIWWCSDCQSWCRWWKKSWLKIWCVGLSDSEVLS